MERWKRPYPPEQQEARAMCNDPVAVAWAELERWLKARNFKIPITMADATDCLWSHAFGDSMTRYDIMRNDEYFPDAMPDDVFKRVTKGLFGKG